MTRLRLQPLPSRVPDGGRERARATILAPNRHSDPVRAVTGERVRDAMVTEPTVHPVSLSVAEARRLFLDDHLHMILLVDAKTLAATIERADLVPESPGDTPAVAIGTLEGRTIEPGAQLREVAASMRSRARRRLAVVDEQGSLVGLLCLKQHGGGFCSDDDVRDRRADRHPRAGEEAA